MMMSPADALHELEGAVLTEGTGLTLEQANQMLSEVSGDLLYLRATVDMGDSNEISLAGV